MAGGAEQTSVGWGANLRRVLLRVMLGSLAVGAAVGAAAVLMAPSAAVWRIVGTCAITAVAAMFMLAAAVLSDKPKSRDAGLLGMAIVLLEYAGAVLLIWNIPQTLFVASNIEERVGLSMLALAPLGVFAMAMMRAAQHALTRLAGITGLVLSAIDLVLWLIAIWGSRIWDDEDWFGTAGAFAAFGLTATASLVGNSKHPARRAVRWGGVLASFAALCVTLAIIWDDLRGEGGAYTILVTVVVYLAYLNLLLTMPLPASQQWIRIGTLVAAAITGACIDLAVVDKNYGFSEWTTRVGSAAGIVTCCGTLALAILARSNRRITFEGGEQALTELHEIVVICPVCNRKQLKPIGDSNCAGCGLIFHLAIEAPRCPSCGYVLLMNSSDRCPECGAPRDGAGSPHVASPVTT